MIKKLLVVSMVAASLGATATSVFAQIDIYVQVAPPAPRYEVVPAPRRGQVWVPGHWDWQGRRHVWVGGQWVVERPGYRYNQARWVERDGRWGLERGRWSRGDSDRDGIANKRDRDRDGDGVPNNRDRDRDGDGVRNSQDRQPDNPRRN